MSGWATRHAPREASGVPRPLKVERRRQRHQGARRDGGLLKIADLERAGCSLPWGEGEESRSLILLGLKIKAVREHGFRGCVVIGVLDGEYCGYRSFLATLLCGKTSYDFLSGGLGFYGRCWRHRLHPL